MVSIGSGSTRSRKRSSRLVEFQESIGNTSTTSSKLAETMFRTESSRGSMKKKLLYRLRKKKMNFELNE